MFRAIFTVVALIAVLAGPSVNLSVAWDKYAPRIEGVSEWEIAEWQAYYGYGPFMPVILVPGYAAPVMPPPLVRPPSSKKRGRLAPCKEPLW
ncbi:MAG: hypothetical protein LDL33_10065 [Desulfomonile sp.]|nr:hypothetical protein [Desulfomonile sp.]